MKGLGVRIPPESHRAAAKPAHFETGRPWAGWPLTSISRASFFFVFSFSPNRRQAPPSPQRASNSCSFRAPLPSRYVHKKRKAVMWRGEKRPSPLCVPLLSKKNKRRGPTKKARDIAAVEQKKVVPYCSRHTNQSHGDQRSGCEKDREKRKDIGKRFCTRARHGSLLFFFSGGRKIQTRRHTRKSRHCFFIKKNIKE